MTIDTIEIVKLSNSELDALYHLKTLNCDGIPCGGCPFHIRNSGKSNCLKYTVGKVYDDYLESINKSIDDEDYNYDD